jgi:hypothetical protein
MAAASTQPRHPYRDAASATDAASLEQTPYSRIPGDIASAGRMFLIA